MRSLTGEPSCPFLNPGVAVVGDLIRRNLDRLVGHLGVLHEGVRQLGVLIHRVHEHLLRHVLLERHAEHEIHELLRQGQVLSALQDADELDLAEAGIGVQDGSGGRFRDGRVGEDHLGCRAGSVRQHQGLGALAGGAAEIGVVGRLPAVHHYQAVILELAPVIQEFVGAVVGHGDEQEGQAGRGGGRVFDHQQALVFRLEQIVQALRHGQVLAGEVSLVVVEAHVAIIHGEGVMGGVELEFRRDVRQQRGSVGGVDARLEGAREEGVVHAVEHVGQRGVLGEDGAVEGRAGVAALDEVDLDVVGVFERLDHRRGDGERIVGHHVQSLRPAGGGRGGGRSRSAGRQDQAGNRQPHKGEFHRSHNRLLPYAGFLFNRVWTHNNRPRVSDTEADAPANTLLMPRVCSGYRVSSLSG